VSIDVILSKFTFVGPDEKVTPEALAALLDPAPSLVVFDGVSEAMYLHGWMGNDTDGAAAYRRHLVKPCTAAGAAVLSADHVPKDQDKQGRSAIGSIHKGNGLTGSLIKLENVEAFGRDRRGASKVFVTKDRPGYLLRHGRPDKKRTPGKTYMGMLVVDDTRQWVQYLDLAFLAPREEDEAAGADGQDDPDEVAVLAAVVKLTKKGVPANVNKILATARINRTRGIAALTRLELRGGVTMTVQGQAHVFTVPETGSEDHSSATTGETP
jgi:hypothetical protein